MTHFSTYICMIKVTNIRYEPLSGQVVVGGSETPLSNFDFYSLSSIELFPRPPSDNCSIPDLPQARDGPSLSLLSGGRLVVCGGEDGNNLDSCISWVAGETSWTPFHTMRCLIPIMLHIIIFTITAWQEFITRPIYLV